MKERRPASSTPLITLLFPQDSNVRKNTQWQVCKRASSKLLSGKINGGACGLLNDLRGQLVTAPRRCWGQQRSESVREREREIEQRRRGGGRGGERKNDCVHEEDREVHFNRYREKTRKEKVRGNTQAIMNDLLDACGTLCAPDGLFLFSRPLTESWATGTRAPA